MPIVQLLESVFAAVLGQFDKVSVLQMQGLVYRRFLAVRYGKLGDWFLLFNCIALACAKMRRWHGRALSIAPAAS